MSPPSSPPWIPSALRKITEELNEAILDLGMALAEMESAELHVLHAWSPWGGVSSAKQNEVGRIQ